MRFRILLTVFSFFALSFAYADNPRIFITDSHSWELSAGAGSVNGTLGASGSGGARGQTAELVKTFNQRCPNAIVNDRRDRADYIVLFDHEGGKSAINRDNKIVIFNQVTGDAVFSRSTRSLGNAVKDACTALFHDWSRREAVAASNKEMERSYPGTPRTEAAAVTRLQVISAPGGADIAIDGAFVGNTPSTVALPPGDHQVVVTKNGYAPWQRTVHVSGGDITLNAELARAQ